MDAAMAILTIHHWDDDQERGSERCAVARGPVVILTYDFEVSGRMWLLADYLPRPPSFDRRIFPSLDALARWLDAEVTVRRCRFPATRPTGHSAPLGSPRAGLDPQARNATSGFARMTSEVVDRVVEAVARDLQDGTWDARHGHLRGLDEYDAAFACSCPNPCSASACSQSRAGSPGSPGGSPRPAIH